jgi:hypothetical protein
VPLAAVTGLGYLVIRPAFPGKGTLLTRSPSGAAAAADVTVVYTHGKARRFIIGLGLIFGGTVGAELTGNVHRPEPPKEEQVEEKKDKKEPKGSSGSSGGGGNQ